MTSRTDGLLLVKRSTVPDRGGVKTRYLSLYTTVILRFQSDKA